MKEKLKNILLCLLALIVIFIILYYIVIGFLVSSDPNKNNLRIYFKSSDLYNVGYSSVVGDEKIYYVSNESGETGIYSMDMDGSNVQLEGKDPSITSLQWRDGALYFAGLEKIEDNTATVWMTDHIYTVYKKMPGKYAMPKASFVENDENVRGFYLISDGYAAVNYSTQGYGSRIKCHDSSFQIDTGPGKAHLDKKGTVCFEVPITEPESTGEKEKEEINIFTIGDAYLITTHENDRDLTGDTYILDSQTGKVVLSPDNEGQFFENFQVLLMDEDYLYCFYKNRLLSQTGQMVIVNRETWEVEKMFPLGDIAETHRVSYAMKRDGKIYMLVTHWLTDDTAVVPMKNQKLLVMDPETFEWEVVRDMKEGERIVGLDERGIVYLADGGIWKAEWEGEALGGETRLCDAPKDIDKEKYTIDYAGDWMFVYKIYGDFTTGIREIDPGQQLVYKINLKTGEIIENTVPLDFSQVNPYRRDPKTK